MSLIWKGYWAVIAVVLALTWSEAGWAEPGSRAAKPPTPQELWKSYQNARDSKASSKTQKVKHSGKRNKNVRSSISSMPNKEFVSGTIAGVKGNTLWMDGERFHLGSAKIKTKDGQELKAKDVRPGLKASVVLAYGSVDSVILEGYNHAGFRGTAESLHTLRAKGGPAPNTRPMIPPDPSKVKPNVRITGGGR